MMTLQSLTHLNHETKRNKHVWAWMKESFFQTCEFSHQWTSLLQSVLSALAQSGLRADLIRCEMALWPPRARPFEVTVYFLDSIVCLVQFTLSQWKTMAQEWLTLLCLEVQLRCQELFILWFTLYGVSWPPRDLKVFCGHLNFVPLRHFQDIFVACSIFKSNGNFIDSSISITFEWMLSEFIWVKYNFVG